MYTCVYSHGIARFEAGIAKRELGRNYRAAGARAPEASRGKRMNSLGSPRSLVGYSPRNHKWPAAAQLPAPIYKSSSLCIRRGRCSLNVGVKKKRKDCSDGGEILIRGSAGLDLEGNYEAVCGSGDCRLFLKWHKMHGFSMGSARYMPDTFSGDARLYLMRRI